MAHPIAFELYQPIFLILGLACFVMTCKFTWERNSKAGKNRLWVLLGFKQKEKIPLTKKEAILSALFLTATLVFMWFAITPDLSQVLQKETIFFILVLFGAALLVHWNN